MRGDRNGPVICRNCGAPEHANGRALCRQCVNAYAREWRRTHPAQQAAIVERHRRKKQQLAEFPVDPLDALLQ